MSNEVAELKREWRKAEENASRLAQKAIAAEEARREADECWNRLQEARKRHRIRCPRCGGTGYVLDE